MRSPVREILGPDGPIARSMASASGTAYEPREQQLLMAEAVQRALTAKETLLVEAGTGVGKSFAYLVPAILKAVAMRQRVVIATNTIALQEQLVKRDIPFLQETLNEWGLGPIPVLIATEEAQKQAERELERKRSGESDSDDDPSFTPGFTDEHGNDILDHDDHAHDDPRTSRNSSAGSPATPDGSLPPAPLVPVLCKGRGNYVSIRRLQMASQRQDRLFNDAAQRRSLHIIEDWAMDTQDGTLASLPPMERAGVWDRVQSDTDNCMGRKCPQYLKCFYQRSRRAMQLGNILICNHALFFADLSLRRSDAGFLPNYDHVILDESHGVEDAACDHFGLTLSEGRVEHLLASLYHPGTGRGYLPQLSMMLDASGKGPLVDAVVNAVMEASAVSRAFFEELLELDRSGRLKSGRITEANIIMSPLGVAMRTLGAKLKLLKAAAPGEPDQFELNGYATRAEAIAFDADALNSQAIVGAAYWVEISGSGASRGGYKGGRGGGGGVGVRVKLCCSPVEVAPILKEHLFSQKIGVILTSATIALGGKTDDDAFKHFKTRLGCEDAKTLRLGSPFDYARQAKVIVDLAMSNPRDAMSKDSFATQRSGYTDQLAQRILHHVTATDGGAFVLFTSFDALYRVADSLSGVLDRAGMPLLAQGRDGTPGQVLQRFRENPRSVLLGAMSFWQGVDVRGDALRNVIITKLPFDPPDRPIVMARCERIKARGGDPFSEDSLPRAVLRFKQGFGRLIRSASDTGQVVVLDPRLVTARYGKRFLDALPPGVPVTVLDQQQDDADFAQPAFED